MRASNDKRADSGRFLRRSFLFACLASLLLCSSSKADTVLIFGQSFPTDNVTLHNGGGDGLLGDSTLSTAGNFATGGMGVSIPVIITTFMGVPGVNLPAFETFVGVASSAPAMATSGFDIQAFGGKIEFSLLPGGPSGPGTNFLTVTFSANSATDSSLSGVDGGHTAGLQATQPTANVTFTSDFGAFHVGTSQFPVGMSLSFTNLSKALSIFNGSLGHSGDTTMQNSGVFSATIVPEPSTMAIAGLGALGMIGYGLRRRKALGA